MGDKQSTEKALGQQAQGGNVKRGIILLALFFGRGVANRRKDSTTLQGRGNLHKLTDTSRYRRG